MVELLTPQESGQRLAHHVTGVGGESLGRHRGVKLIRLVLTLCKSLLEVNAEGFLRGYHRPVRKPQPHGRRLSRADAQGVMRGSLRPHLSRVYRLPRAVDDVII